MTTRNPLTPPEPAPERLAPCPDCGGPLTAEGFWPANQQIGELEVKGAKVIIVCAFCGEEFGPVVFISRDASTDTIASIAPNHEEMKRLAIAGGLEVQDDDDE